MKNFFYLLILTSFFASCQNELSGDIVDPMPPSLGPTLTTVAATLITDSSVTSGGIITSDGGSPIIKRGVCWAIASNPNVLGSHTSEGTGTGSFTSLINGLTPSTLYYLRAYAINATDTAYGNQVTFTTTGSVAPPSGTIFIGALDGKLYALDANTGNTKWTFQTGSDIFSSATVVGNLVIFGSYDRSIYAVNRNTGLEYWRFYTGAENFGGMIENAPVFNSGTVYFGCNNGRLYAVDTTTEILGGTAVHPIRKWFSQISGIAMGGMSGPTVSNGLVFISGSYKTFEAHSASTGALVWSYTLDDLAIGSNPVVLNDTAYVYDHSTVLYAFNATTGALFWKRKIQPGFTGAMYGSPTVRNGTIYVPAGNYICAVNAYSGVTKWFTEYPGEAGSIVNGAIANGILYGTSNNGHLYAWDATTGALKWKYYMAYAINSSPTVADGTVYFAGINGHMYAVDALTGAIKWDRQITPVNIKIYSSACVVDVNGNVHLPGVSGEQQ